MKQKLNCMLLVDDDEGHNYLNQVVIEKAAVTKHIRTVWNGKEAIDYLMHRGKYQENGETYPKPEVIFLDINMPVMDGWDFMEEYHKLDAAQKSGITIVMLTTSLNPDDKNRAQGIAEISDFVNKPLTLHVLDKMVQQYFADRV